MKLKEPNSIVYYYLQLHLIDIILLLVSEFIIRVRFINGKVGCIHKLFFLDTWRQLFPQGGSEYVNLNIEFFVKFYCAQIAADNHAVREAACACIAELAQKCSPEALENQWEPMLNSLID